ncbi:MAG TPA: DUF167 domain-containing protein [Acidimicrobiales bacterium]|jgi:uncharacterized protein YggU (UPF0235/DUF167 family)|nr:DUF167 domain-containing protein [Acidimicrobiales bacterium]
MSGIAGDLFTLDRDASNEDHSVIEILVSLRAEAGATKIAGRAGAGLQIQCAAPAASERANESCTALLATTLGIELTAVTLTTGQTGRQKHFRAEVTDLDDVRRKLDAALEEAAMANVAKGRRSR